MKKISTFTATHMNYNIPVIRQATIYQSDIDEFKGRPFEVSYHTGNPNLEWKFKPFASLSEAQDFALKFLCKSLEKG